MTYKWTKIGGRAADAGQCDDEGEETFLAIDGPHAGHTVTVFTAKHNCGAWSEVEECSCGATHANAMDGCWQQGHQREETGDTSLAEYNERRLDYARGLAEYNERRLDYARGFDVYCRGLSRADLSNDDEIRGWWAANRSAADAETDAYLYERQARRDNEIAIRESFAW